MLVTLLLILQNLLFTLTIARDGTIATLRYPKSVGVTWLEVCVEADGHGDVDIDRNEDAHPWYKSSCWPPRFATEDYELPAQTYHVRARLLIDNKGERRTLNTPIVRVRPE